MWKNRVKNENKGTIEKWEDEGEKGIEIVEDHSSSVEVEEQNEDEQQIGCGDLIYHYYSLIRVI
jgi:hypothetical protein